MPDRDEFIIKVEFGGLGDHLFYSHLPRAAKSLGFGRVYISNHSAYRHQDYRKLVWELNPFVDGFSDEDAPYPRFGGVREGANLLDEIMLQRGLDDGKRLHEPEIFYSPQKLETFSECIVYDPNFVSYVGAVNSRQVTRYFRYRKLPVDTMLVPRGRSLPIAARSQYITRDVFDYCDLIASCREFVCLTSGGATLAAALGVKATALWGEGQMSMFHHSKRHNYIRVGRIGTLRRSLHKLKMLSRIG